MKTPTYVQAGREDHIAPPQSVWKITHHFQGPMRFVLAGSGHIAGVVNPPEAQKYQYWTNERRSTRSRSSSPARRRPRAAGGPTGSPGSSSKSDAEGAGQGRPHPRQGQAEGDRGRAGELREGALIVAATCARNVAITLMPLRRLIAALHKNRLNSGRSHLFVALQHRQSDPMATEATQCARSRAQTTLPTAKRRRAAPTRRQAGRALPRPRPRSAAQAAALAAAKPLATAKRRVATQGRQGRRQAGDAAKAAAPARQGRRRPAAASAAKPSRLSQGAVPTPPPRPSRPAEDQEHHERRTPRP